MARTRVSTTIDEALLSGAREVTGVPSDGALLDRALSALFALHRSAEIDRAYAAYEEHPLDEPDERGDLASFRAAAGVSRSITRGAVRSGGASLLRSVAVPS